MIAQKSFIGKFTAKIYFPILDFNLPKILFQNETIWVGQACFQVWEGAHRAPLCIQAHIWHTLDILESHSFQKDLSKTDHRPQLGMKHFAKKFQSLFEDHQRACDKYCIALHVAILNANHFELSSIFLLYIHFLK